MDRIDAMRVFIAALDEGSLAGAGRQLGRSPAAVSRAIAFLEQQVGAPLLHRTTRAIKLSEIGERYAAACRRVLVDLQEAEMVAAGEQAAPRGTLTVTAPPISGEEILRPIIDAYLEAFPAVSVNLVLLDRNANLVEEGIDVALRVAELPDSSMVAVRVGGDVRRVVVASPRYLAQHPRIDESGDLAKHLIVTTTHFGRDAWVFPPARGSSIARSVQFKPRLVVNSVRAALAAAVGGLGVTRLYTYHVAERVHDGSLELLLRDAEPPVMPISLLMPQGRMSVPKVRAFVDFAVPRLRAEFARLSTDALALKS
jgi:DNA-binding transcriptional LysR family regulator